MIEKIQELIMRTETKMMYIADDGKIFDLVMGPEDTGLVENRGDG